MANNLLDSLFAGWLFDEASGARLAVFGGHDFAVEAGNVAATTGIRGNACNFGGDTANRLSFEDSTAKLFSFGDQSFSVMAWVKSSRGQNHPYLAKWQSAASPVHLSWVLWNRSTTLSHRFSISSDGTSEETFVDVANPDTTGTGDWQLVIAGYDKEAGVIWISLDGGAKVTAAHSGGAFAGSAADLTPGWFQGAASMLMGNQDQDEPFVWKRALDDADIAAIWNGGAGLAFSEWELAAAVEAASAAARHYAYYYR